MTSKSVILSSSAIKRLHDDYKQLQEEPLVGANAQPVGDDISKWRGIVVGIKGSPYEGVPIRFALEFPADYPNTAPSAFFETEISYNGGASYRNESGRLVVCLNIFGNFAKVHDEWASQSEGWTPTYTVTTILVSMQGLMMDDMLSKKATDIEKAKKAANEFVCKETGHVGSDPTTWFPKIPTEDEVFKTLADKRAKATPYDPLKDHYICYVKKTSAKDGAVLGFGVSLDNPKSGKMSSTCEYLSKDAFDAGTRKSSLNKDFKYFLPILVESSRWKETKDLFAKSVSTLCTDSNNGRMKPHEMVFKVCSSIMNSMVVEIMNNKNNLKANDKFVDGYFTLFRMMKRYSLDDKNLVKLADDAVETFLVKETRRTKQYLPDLGEFLIYLTLSQKFNWKDVADFFIEECDARNFMWYAVGTFKQYAKYPELADPKNITGRATKVFSATEISRNLVMFQVKFAEVAKKLSLDDMDVSHGLAPKELRDSMRDMYNHIVKVKDWNGYFEWLGMSKTTEEQRSKDLVTALHISKSSGYHK